MPGGCACLDGQLRGLLASHRRAEAPVRSAVEELPELTPDMLLSGDLLAEWNRRNARQVPPRAAQTAPAPQRAPVRQESPKPASLAGRRPLQEDAVLASLWGSPDGGEADAEPFRTAEPRAAALAGRPLESLWMSDDDLSSLGGEYMSEASQVASSEFDIDFDMDDVDMPRGPISQNRFRVDRAPALSPTPTGPRVANVMLDGGETVGNRTAMRDAARNFREVRAAAREPAPRAAPTRVAATRTAPPARQAPARPAPSAYQRLLRGGGI